MIPEALEPAETSCNYSNIFLKNQAHDEILRLEMKKIKPIHLGETSRRVKSRNILDLYTTISHFKIIIYAQILYSLIGQIRSKFDFSPPLHSYKD